MVYFFREMITESAFHQCNDSFPSSDAVMHNISIIFAAWFFPIQLDESAVCKRKLQNWKSLRNKNSHCSVAFQALLPPGAEPT